MILTDSKENIKNRMIRIASGLWGYSDTEDINSFDPLVGMIIGSLAEELYHIAGEIKKTDARIVEKLHDTLFGQHFFSHFPAHAVAVAQPLQPGITISETYQFSFTKKTPRTVNKETVYENKPIYFTPTSNVTLLKGEVKLLSGGNQIFGVTGQSKELLGTADFGTVSDFSKIYIGLKLDQNIERLDGLTLMFGLKGRQNEERFLSLLPSASWKINNREVLFAEGFEAGSRDEENSLTSILRKEHDISYKACTFVNDLYRSRFVVLEEKGTELKGLLRAGYRPAEIEHNFPEYMLKSVPGDLLWIEIQLPQPVSAQTIQDLTVSMNCFPVINRQLNEFTLMLNKGINIVPLKTADLFFDIRKITNSKGELFPLLSSYKESDPSEGYMIRQGGIGRFDSRDAKETIANLIDLIRDERAGFSALGADLIASDLKQLDQVVARLNQRLESSNIAYDSTSYLILNCKSPFERALIQFWSTSGELANNIRSDSKLSLHLGGDIDNNSIYLRSATSGGQQKLSEEDKMNKLRRVLLSKGRVVTHEDIRALCFEHFGKELEKVEIKKGVQVDHSIEKGLMRTLDIHLFLKKKGNFSEEDLKQKMEGLKVRLRQESVNLLPYNIFAR